MVLQTTPTLPLYHLPGKRDVRRISIDPFPDTARYSIVTAYAESQISDEESTIGKKSPVISTLPLPAIAKPSPRPQPQLDRLERLLIWFELYRRFFAVIFILNIAALGAAANHKFGYGRKNATAIALGNLLACVLARNELFLRFCYWLTVKTCSWLPVRLRHAITDCFVHVGGIHSGCATAGLAWAIYSCVIAFNAGFPGGVLICAVLAPIALFISIFVAMPWIRHRHHNLFEQVHRFVGWLGIILIWCLVLLVASFDFQTRTFSAQKAFLWRRQELWFTVILTMLIIAPWVGLRKIPVTVDATASTAFLTFPGGVYTGLIGRISRSPLLEWHAFGLISDGPLAFTHHMLMVAQGDWTREMLANPPTHLWTRSLKAAGLPYLAEMYERAVIVATGAGIGVTLSVMLQAKGIFHLIWIGSDLEKTYGHELLTIVRRAAPADRLTIIDTKLSGRPDTVQLIDETYRRSNSQAVFCTSNPKGTEIITRGCRERGIPCFGPLFDS
ncbi:hypothetical protein PYCC9005_001309 [Savitreella phatthalungensis]